MKNKSYDSKAMKTYSDSIRRKTYNNSQNNTNDNFNYQTTGIKFDYTDFNKITEENKKEFRDKEVPNFLVSKAKDFFLNNFNKIFFIIYNL